jgi:hypothetical protein
VNLCHLWFYPCPFPDKVWVDKLIEPQISQIRADSVEGREEERPQKNAHNRMLLAAKE